MLPSRQHFWRLPRICLTHYIPWSRRFTSTDATKALNVPQTLTLRPYQEETISAILDYVNAGGKRAGISLATGSGKTVVFAQLIERIPSRSPDATQTLILAHRKELVEQAYRHCKKAYPEKSVEIELAKVHATGVADITVASMQSITSKDRIEKFDQSLFKLVIVDEAHHIVAPTYLQILEHFNLRTLQDDSPILTGFSATLARADGLKLGAVIDHIVYHKDYVEMINENWLADTMFTTVRIEADLSKVETKGGDFLSASLSKAVNTSENNEAAFTTWKERAGDRHSTLIFCVDVQHIVDITATFRRNAVEAHYVTGETPNKQRSEILEAFKAREFPVLLNCGVFTEGTDIPNIDCVVLARPTKSRNLLQQMIGRGSRLYAGKDNCHVIDMVSSLKTGIVTTPTLFGLDPDELVEESTSADMIGRKARKEAEAAAAAAALSEAQVQNASLKSFEGSLTFTDYDSVNDLLADTSGERHIRTISQYAWVKVDENRYILSTNSGNFISVFRNDGNGVYKVFYTPKNPMHRPGKNPRLRPREIAVATTLLHAVAAADTHAANVFQHIFIATNAPWRQRPASEKQLEFLNKTRDEEDQLQIGDVTKGQATDMITKLKHGAKGRYKKLASNRQRVLREQEKPENTWKGPQLLECFQAGHTAAGGTMKATNMGEALIKQWSNKVAPWIHKITKKR